MPQVKSLLKGLTPPYAWSAAKFALRSFGAKEGVDPERLFDGDDALFKDAIQTALVYGEYGVGASTIWVARNYDIPMISVDSSSEWLDLVRKKIPQNKWTAKHVDVGPLADWGTPQTHSLRANYKYYPRALWQSKVDPDLVLVDGRFRVACFLTCLLEAKPGTKIIFDDYVDRPNYHLVEEFCQPCRRSVRQVLFVVPEVLDFGQIEKTRDEFIMVTE